MTAESANTVHGRLLEAVHIAGYSFERACGELQWLLDDDRWRGLGFSDGAAFAESVMGAFREFRMTIEQRQALARSLTRVASQRAVAKVLGVNHATVSRDVANATPRPEAVIETADGESASVASATAEPAAAQPWFQRDADPSALARKQEKQENKREERLATIAEISKGNRELSIAVRYPIVYADPPWRYENPPIGASNRSIENHYPTMTLEEICSLPVRDLATDDALLYLWATAPKLAECMSVIEAWGFSYRTNMVWDKEAIGMGYHARNQHEILLIAKRGEIPPPAAGTQPSSVYRERRAEHSAKPAFFREMIEAAYPQLPKIELFSRSPHDGWAAWGNQSEATP